MDAIGLRILEHLRDNARVNASEIGESINMSVSAVIERIKKLEAAGIIKQYTVVLDNKKIDKDVSAYISVRLEHPKYHDPFTAAVNEIDEVTECHYIAGDFDFMLRLFTSTTESLTKLLNQVKSLPGVSLTRTLVVLSTIKEASTVLPTIEKN